MNPSDIYIIEKGKSSAFKRYKNFGGKLQFLILGWPINTRTYTLLRAKKFTANKRYKFLGPEQCICAGIYGPT